MTDPRISEIRGFNRAFARWLGLFDEFYSASSYSPAEGRLFYEIDAAGHTSGADLSRGFNRMLSEVEVNRARIEFLQRMDTWQEMAEENAYSRIPLGVHIRMDCKEGLRLGNLMALKALYLDLQK